MKRGFKQTFTALIIFALLFSFVPSIQLNATEDDSTTITVLGTSDLHGRLYPYEYATGSDDTDAGLAKLFTLIKEERAKNANNLLLDCGDTLQDNSADLFNDLDVHPMIQAMNTMGYDTWTLGNHEFNFGMDFLNKNIAGFDGAVLSANIYNEATGERFVKPYEIFDVNGVKIAIVGMTPPAVPTWEASTPDHFKDLKFTSILEETKKVLTELEGKYDVLVGAYHDGPDGEYDYAGIEIIAENYPEFDVIFGGHAHSQYQNEVNGVQLIEPGKYGWALAKANISIKKENEKWVVESVETANLQTIEVAADEDILKQFEYVHTKSLAEANKVVGKISADFIARPDYITGDATVTTMPTAQIEDNAVIDLINEVQSYYANAELSSAALFKFNSNLKAGDFKKKDVAFIYMYDNTLVGVNITGANLKKYMEWSASYYNTAKDGDITVSFNPNIRGYNYDMFSGVNYQIDISKEAGSRIINTEINGEPINDNKVYKLAVNNYRFGTLMSLGLVSMEDKYYDSYTELQDAGRIRDLIVKYTDDIKNGVLEPTVDNNWEIVGFDFNNSYKDEVFNLVTEGKITIPTSEDGRTLNVKALNANDLISEGVLKEKATTVIYIIQPGDVLWKIAQKYGITYQELAKMNSLSNPDLIYAGETLLVPEK